MNATARVITIVLGGALVVVGAVALARTGLPGGTVPPHTDVWIFHRTAMSAAVEVVLGLLLAASGVVSRDGRGILVMSALVLVPGVVLVAAPGTWHDWVGAHRVTGVLYTAAGLLGVTAGMLSLRAARERERLDRAAGIGNAGRRP